MLCRERPACKHGSGARFAFQVPPNRADPTIMTSWEAPRFGQEAAAGALCLRAADGSALHAGASACSVTLSCNRVPAPEIGVGPEGVPATRGEIH